MSKFSVSPAHALRRTMLFVVMAALVLVQTLGLMHRVVHAPQAFLAVHAEATDRAKAPGGWLARLYAAHEANGCESYDQLAHADFLWGCPAGTTAPAMSSATPSDNSGWQLAAQAAGYLARGPPTPA